MGTAKIPTRSVNYTDVIGTAVRYVTMDVKVNRFNLHNMNYLYKRTRAIDAAIRAGGYKLITIWEHEFDKNKEMRNMKLNEFDLVEPPKITDGFYGGRCEPVKLIYDFDNKERRGKYTVSQKKTRHQTLAHNFPKC